MTDLSGQYLGRYYLSERLGEGGMAVVYKAYDTRLERDVAIKIIRSGAFAADAMGEVLKRFEREAKSLAKLSHPNIVKVYDYGEHEGSPYLVMEYLPGGTLKKMLGEPIPWQDAVQLILPVARGVAYAHQRGVLHRDIKPANVLITESGEPMLSDFGIAKLFEGNQTTALTGSGMAIGTPEYMAPEQWTGITSLQSDLYSLGIVLYEMVAGRKPYVADTPAAILIKQATEPLPNPRKFAVDLPEALEFVLIKALAKEPRDRYKDINAFISALENRVSITSSLLRAPVDESHKLSSPVSSLVSISTQMPISSGIEMENKVDATETLKVEDLDGLSTSRAKGVTSWKRFRKGIAGLFIGGVVIMFAVLLGSPVFEKWFSPTPAPTASAMATTATTIPTEVPSDTPIATPIVTSSWQQGKIAYVARNAGKVYFLYTLDLSQEGQSQLLLMPDKPTKSRYYAPWFASNGQRLAYADSYTGKILIMDTQVGSIPTSIGTCSSPSFAPDGTRVVCYSSGADYFPVYDVETGTVISTIYHGKSGALLPAWSPDGAEIAFSVLEENRTTSIWKINVDGGETIPLATNADEDYAPAWSPDGQWIAFQSTLTSERSEVWIMRSDGSGRKQITFSGGGDIWSRGPCFSPDGKWLAFVSNQDKSDGPDFGDVFVISLLTGELRKITDTGGYVLDWRVTWAK